MLVSISQNRSLVDVESDLKNIDRINSDCPSKYKPHCPKLENCNEGYPCGGGVVAKDATTHKKKQVIYHNVISTQSKLELLIQFVLIEV